MKLRDFLNSFGGRKSGVPGAMVIEVIEIQTDPVQELLYHALEVFEALKKGEAKDNELDSDCNGCMIAKDALASFYTPPIEGYDCTEEMRVKIMLAFGCPPVTETVVRHCGDDAHLPTINYVIAQWLLTHPQNEQPTSDAKKTDAPPAEETSTPPADPAKP